jgi:hypothetical protein
MTTNRLAKPSGEGRVIAPENEAERQRFWVERGNQHLRELGRINLEWVCRNGNYSIEQRR